MTVGRLFAASGALVLWLAGVQPAVGVEVSDLYTAQVATDTSRRGWQEDAYARALADVLVRVTGQRSAGSDLALAALFEDPGSLVQGYRRGAGNTLWVSFDGRALTERLRAAGRAVWSADRPVTLVWLAVDRGRGEREILAAVDDAMPSGAARTADPNRFLRERVDGVASERGIPIVWPLLDAADREAVTFSDIWGGFEQPVIQASHRYSANSVLVGRIDAARPGVAPRWSWYFGGEQRQWRASVEDAMHRVADLMAAQLAAAGEAETTEVRLTITNIGGLQDYAEVGRYLASVSVIRAVALEQFLDDSLTYRLELLGNTERLVRVLRLSGRFDSMESLPGGFPGEGDAELRVAYRR